MAKTSAANAGLMAKLGERGKKALVEHSAEAPKIGGGSSDLPAGIEGGIAKVTMCKLGIYAKGDFEGEYYFTARATVVEPKVVQLPNGAGKIYLEGLATQIGPMPICDTPKNKRSMEVNLQRVQDEVKKLLGPNFDPDSVTGPNLETTIQAIEKAGIYIRFRTWSGGRTCIAKGKDGKYHVYNQKDDGTPDMSKLAKEGAWATEAAAKTANPYIDRDPMVNHDWRGSTSYTAESSPETAVDDSTGGDEVPDEPLDEGGEKTLEEYGAAADEGDEEAIDHLTTLATEAELDPSDESTYPDWATLAAALGESEETEEETEDLSESTDIDALLESANEGNTDAQTRLQSLAMEAGKSEEEVNADDATWEDVAEWAKGSDEESEEKSLAEHGEAADGGDEESIAHLTAAAEEAGLDINDYGPWAELATALEEAGGEETEEEETEWAPAVEGVYKYKALDPKTKKLNKHPEECEVLSVDEENSTVNLWSIDKGKRDVKSKKKLTTYAKVAFDKLIRDSE